MILFSIGLPDRDTAWSDTIIEHIAGVALGPVTSAPLDTPDDIALCLIKTGASHLLVGSRQPSARLKAALRDTNASFVLTLGDARLAVADLMINHGYNLIPAVKFVANSCTALLQLTELPGALAINPANPQAQAPAIAGAIAAHFGFSLPQAVIRDLADAHPLPPDETQIEIETWWSGLGKEGQAMIIGAFSIYNIFVETSVVGKATWERALFMIGDPPNEPATRAIDITGRPRCLLFGPYIALPPGSWTAHVVLGFSKEAAGSGFMVEIYAGAPLSQTRIQPTGEEVIEVSLEFAIEEGFDQGIEIRVLNERAAFDGRIGLGSVTLTPRGRLKHGDDDLLTALSLTSK